jgi:hypothetical protein
MTLKLRSAGGGRVGGRRRSKIILRAAASGSDRALRDGLLTAQAEKGGKRSRRAERSAGDEKPGLC